MTFEEWLVALDGLLLNISSTEDISTWEACYEQGYTPEAAVNECLHTQIFKERVTSDTKPEHRWSGWPGAYCFDCGCEDPREVCLGEHTSQNYTCEFGHVLCQEEHNFPTTECLDHPMTTCPEPGSNRYNPYHEREPDEES